MKLVINVCFGGFGLSDEAVRRYAEIRGLTLYPESDSKFGDVLDPTYWLVPKDKRPKELPGDWSDHPLEERVAYNKAYSQAVLYPRDIPRDCQALVQVVEELGEKASGKFSDLRIVEVPDGVQWQIEEYDGNEHVAEVHQTWR